MIKHFSKFWGWGVTIRIPFVICWFMSYWDKFRISLFNFQVVLPCCTFLSIVLTFIHKLGLALKILLIKHITDWYFAFRGERSFRTLDFGNDLFWQFRFIKHTHIILISSLYNFLSHLLYSLYRFLNSFKLIILLSCFIIPWLRSMSYIHARLILAISPILKIWGCCISSTMSSRELTPTYHIFLICLNFGY